MKSFQKALVLGPQNQGDSTKKITWLKYMTCRTQHLFS